MKKVIIIGGGMAGMAAAVTAARAGADTLVLERDRKPLRKLAASGNGRGNLLNRGAPRYYGSPEYAEALLRAVPRQEVEAFWENAGVPLSEEAEGRVYPSCYLAPVAAEALRAAAREAGAEIRCGTCVTEIRREKGGFTVSALVARYGAETRLKSGRVKPGELLSEEKAVFSADAVILAAGGAAAPVYGTDGSAYALAQALGHTLVPPRPALCALLTEEKPSRELCGQRVRAGLRLLDKDGAQLAASKGEVLFTEDGVSGIAAMQLARFAAPGCRLEIDLTRSLLGDETAGRLERMRQFAVIDATEEMMVRVLRERLERFAGRKGEDFFLGMAAPGLRTFLEKKAESSGNRLSALARLIMACHVTVTGTRGWEAAQVTAGGLRTEDFSLETGESSLCPGFYAAGEILDADGDCGGFNLMFAAAGGIAAGRSAARD